MQTANRQAGPSVLQTFRHLTSTAKPAARGSCRIRSVLLFAETAPGCGAAAAAMLGCIVAAMLLGMVVCGFLLAGNAWNYGKIAMYALFSKSAPKTS